MVEKAVQEGVADKEKVLQVILQRRNGTSAIKAYVQRHTVKYAGDFNEEILKRKRQEEELQSRSITNTMLFTTLLESADSVSEADTSSEDPTLLESADNVSEADTSSEDPTLVESADSDSEADTSSDDPYL